MVAIPKKAGRAMSAANARGIQLGSVIGKTYISTFRAPLVDRLVEKVGFSQHASHRQGGVDLAAFTTRLFKVWSMTEGFPCAAGRVDEHRANA